MSMNMIIIGGGVLMLLLMALPFLSTPDGKAKQRRLNALKDRHSVGPNGHMEKQMRKALASSLAIVKPSGLADRFVPKPELFAKRLKQTGKNWDLGQYTLASGVLLIVVWGAAWFMGVPFMLAFMAGLVIGLGLPHFVISFLIGRRIGKFTTRFPDAIDLMVRGLRSGLPISETLGVVGAELPDPCGSEFRTVGDRIRIGRTMEDALQECADRLGTPEFQFFCVTLSIQRETGGNLAETLAGLSDVLRKRASMKLKIKAMSSESKASAYIIGSLPFIVFVLIYNVNSAYMSKFFVDERLMLLGGGGLCWMGLGAFIMSRMISFEI
jgi:tight adherence protein B